LKRCLGLLSRGYLFLTRLTARATRRSGRVGGGVKPEENRRFEIPIRCWDQKRSDRQVG
jgi:hypothetical protein